MSNPALPATQLHVIDAYWRAANYLSVGQIYLFDNPLLERPLAMTDVKRMLLGHWGTTPGQNFIYAHLNRVIRKYDLDMIYVSGPGATFVYRSDGQFSEAAHVVGKRRSAWGRSGVFPDSATAAPPDGARDPRWRAYSTHPRESRNATSVVTPTPSFHLRGPLGHRPGAPRDR
ncbi:hypothetical protein BH11GEM1_BH11GEM1_19620 [soil metagenome]